MPGSGVLGHGEQGGVGIGMAQLVNVFLYGTGPLVTPRSAYLAQVRRIAPPRLQDRGLELAELAGFCLQEQRGPYVWWQAGPWAGKSALLSTFVLHPPDEVRAQVQVVAFFITARLAGQDTRAAFVAAVTEQLTALTGQPAPSTPDEGLREAWLLDLLAQAAEACRQRQVRLVLLVDGLDEDRSTASGDHAHSIAGLLPAEPPAGMRVIVAGRPNPPIPDDVPHWHPLRDPGIVRRLSASAYAQDLQHLGRAEIKRLVNGSPIEQDLLGLLTAARGGLSGPDLRELTSADLVEIENVLHTVAGRTFTRRTAQWDPATGPEVYLLGHEELQQAATSYLDRTRLAEYRTRLHAWADTYRTPTDGGPPWPADTPEYLLRGYPRMLATTGEVSRLVELVTDPDRHDRMLDLSGGDAAAITEITTCQDLVLAQAEPDLEAMALLSIHRNNLADRNTAMPTDLPAVWAQLGQPARAEALAHAIPDPRWRAEALAALSAALATTGAHDRAEQITGAITDPYCQAKALATLSAAVAATGDYDRAEQLTVNAEQIARAITDPYTQALALAAVAAAVAATGDYDRAKQLTVNAEQIARSITDPDGQEQALAAVAAAVAAAGDHDRAVRIARAIADPDRQAYALVNLARTASTARARRLLGQAFAISKWWIPLRVVTRVEPRVVLRIADVVSGNRRSPPMPRSSPTRR
ncbi:hypothetical protein ODJ79_01985 [Actinoplanes sp. KI2]|uniref:hypothetical protein n=1 Tax=Actinoplanes sp. KI2 TaxID=2983315 RepID=UPI0021D5B490|nr:hypothetical protein [Actinoplanes sp. KI2]MCU7722474.1 hypothetical protein [Actinoplanes sp. KI2]